MSYKEKRRWSVHCMRSMVYRSKLAIDMKKVCQLDNVSYNALGDWLYYRLNPLELDCVKNRMVPDCLEQVRP